MHAINTGSLDAILKPKSIAVIGASPKQGSIGWQILHNLLTYGFQGAAYPVHPSATTVHSIRAYASSGDVPERVDLAILVIPAPPAEQRLTMIGRGPLLSADALRANPHLEMHTKGG